MHDLSRSNGREGNHRGTGVHVMLGEELDQFRLEHAVPASGHHPGLEEIQSQTSKLGETQDPLPLSFLGQMGDEGVKLGPALHEGALREEWEDASSTELACGVVDRRHWLQLQRYIVLPQIGRLLGMQSVELCGSLAHRV